MGGSESTQNSGNRDDNIGGDEVRTNNRERDADAAVAATAGVVLGAAAVAAAAVCLIGLAFGSDSEESRKTMKAPGRDDRIFRDDFEDDPARYFRSLRKKN